MIMLTLSSVYATILYLGARHSHSGGIGSSIWKAIGFLWIFKYALIGLYKSLNHLRRACLGVTMYEEIRASRIRKSLGQSVSEKVLRRHFWRFPTHRFPTGDLPREQVAKNFTEFSNQISMDEYFLKLIGADTPLVKCLGDRSWRTINMYKFS